MSKKPTTTPSNGYFPSPEVIHHFHPVPDHRLMLELEQFNLKLNEDPPQVSARELSPGKIHWYVPIGIVQNDLTEIFGIWQTRVPHPPQVFGNEVSCTLELWVYHPVMKQWVCHIGTAATPIRTKAKTDFTDLRNKLPNSLEADFPHVYADALTNAAQKFGRRFGRDLNRDQDKTDQYRPILIGSVERLRELEEEKANLEKSLAVLQEYREKVMEYDDHEDLWKDGKDIGDKAVEAGLMEHDLETLRALFKTRSEELKIRAYGNDNA